MEKKQKHVYGCKKRRSNVRCSFIKRCDTDTITPTLNENKPYCTHYNSHKSKREEKSNRKDSKGAEHQHCQGQHRAAAEVLPKSCIHQLWYLWMIERHDATITVTILNGRRADLLQPLFYISPSSKKCVFFFFLRLSVWCFTAKNLTPLDCSHVHCWQLKFPLCSLKIRLKETGLRERLVNLTDILAQILAQYSVQTTPVKTCKIKETPIHRFWNRSSCHFWDFNVEM